LSVAVVGERAAGHREHGAADPLVAHRLRFLPGEELVEPHPLGLDLTCDFGHGPSLSKTLPAPSWPLLTGGGERRRAAIT
jgi:hypothetical protein